MSRATRILLEVGDYSKSSHFAVIGVPTAYYVWYKPKGQRGVSSKMLTGHQGFRHYTHMHDLLNANKNEEGFVSYLTDLFMANPEIKKVA